MKKFDTFLRNENAMAMLVIAVVFVVITLVSLWVYSRT